MDLQNLDNPLYFTKIDSVFYNFNSNRIEIVDKETWVNNKKRGIIFKNYFLTMKPSVGYNLYDLNTDPLLQNDIKSKNVETYKEMKIKLEEYIVLSNSY